MCTDFRKESSASVTNIKGEQIQGAKEYKFLRVFLDYKLSWDKWTEAVNKKGQQRLYFFRKMVSFNISLPLFKVFYNSFIESVLTFCITFAGLEMLQWNERVH